MPLSPPRPPFRSRDAPAGVARDLSERGFVFARVVVAARQKKEIAPLGVVFFFWRAATTTRAKTNALSSCSLGGVLGFAANWYYREHEENAKLSKFGSVVDGFYAKFGVGWWWSARPENSKCKIGNFKILKVKGGALGAPGNLIVKT